MRCFDTLRQAKIRRKRDSNSQAPERISNLKFVDNTTNAGKFATGMDKAGRIDAIPVETGRTLWNWETRVANNGSMDR